MSHLTIGGLAITCIDSLKKAVLRNPKLRWVDKTEFQYYGHHKQKCVAAIQLIGGTGDENEQLSEEKPYRSEIGVMDNGDGTYRLGWDQMYSKLNDIIGVNCEVIGEDYLREMAQAEAARTGFTYSEYRDENGELVINLDE